MNHATARHRRLRPTMAALLVAAAVASCGSDDERPSATASGSTSPTGPASGDTVRLVAYDSFPTKDTTLNEALDAFSERTGIEVELVIAGDAGTMVTKATLTAGNPEGDVLFGVDNTLLSRALEAKVFTPYRPTELSALAPELTALAPGNEVTPIDYGDVCVNFDIAELRARNVQPPTSLEDLAKPQYRDMLVVEDPGSSSPGLAFLLATISHFGRTGWQQYWRDLRANGVEVVDSWTTAYYDSFSGAGDGTRPLVVSYGSSPPAEVIFADPKPSAAPTGVVAATCFRQVEFAGVLRGTKHEAAARALVDFLASREFQQELALNLFVYPSRRDVPLPEEFVKYAVVPAKPLTMAPADIAASREAWVDEWTRIVQRS